eukprot:scaffold5264_cov125-Skeletonema_dohrnii-CCMP3373.AAC.3
MLPCNTTTSAAIAKKHLLERQSYERTARQNRSSFFRFGSTQMLFSLATKPTAQRSFSTPQGSSIISAALTTIG